MKRGRDYWRKRAHAVERALRMERRERQLVEGIMATERTIEEGDEGVFLPAHISLDELLAPFIKRLRVAIGKVDPDFDLPEDVRYGMTLARKRKRDAERRQRAKQG